MGRPGVGRVRARGSVCPVVRRRNDPPDCGDRWGDAHADLVVLLEVDEPFLTALADTPVGVSHPYPPTSQGEAWANTLAGVGTFQRTHTDLPLILAGDFNAGRGHAAFRSATSGLDTPAGLGSRIGQWTWPMGEAIGPFTTLDHILTRDFGVMSARTLTIPGTDHAAVTATLTVCPAG